MKLGKGVSKILPYYHRPQLHGLFQIYLLDFSTLKLRFPCNPTIESKSKIINCFDSYSNAALEFYLVAIGPRRTAFILELYFTF